MGNRLSRIYTRTGDDGSTGLGDGSRVAKDSARVNAYGTVDEANSTIGLVLASDLPDDIRTLLTAVQHQLFDLGGELCIPGHAAIFDADIERLEHHLDAHNDGLPPLKEFILPGGGTAPLEPESACLLPATMGDIPLDFDTLNQYGCFIGSAAVIIFSDKDQARGAARNVMKFFAEESCGQCTPCRVGTAKALQLMDMPRWDQGLLEELSGAMADASICGLGQAAPNPVRTVMKYFPKEVE